MIVFPNCKINLGLHILRKRSDGYHDIATFFYPFPLNDALEIIPKDIADESGIQLSTSGIPIDAPVDSNLCVKAYQLLKKDYPQLPGVIAHLHKVIPSGAGLGGGSADAAFMLQLLNDAGQLQLSDEQLSKYALQLGSDCPFFLLNKPCFATGQGEQLVPYALDLSAYNIMIVNPGIHVDTGKAFASITPAVPSITLQEVISKPVSNWKSELINDFETGIFAMFPEIGDIKKSLYDIGAEYASMSGSGSTVYGLFAKDESITHSFPANYFIRTSAGQRY